MHGKKGTFKRKESDYALQLREKQKARRIYGVQERQFRRYFRERAAREGHDRRHLAADCSSAGWTTSSTAWAWPIPGRRRASWCATAISCSTATTTTCRPT